MSDTEIDIDIDTGAAPPEPIFSTEDSIADLWVRAYQGEVLGEILFGGIADQLDNPEHARKMRVLATLERCSYGLSRVNSDLGSCANTSLAT
jgi:hypothetical protein